MHSCSLRYISHDDEVSDTIYSVAGTVTFIIGFTGCVGALRENTCLLAAVSVLWDSIKLFPDYFNCPTSFGTSNFDRASGSLRDIYGLSLAGRRARSNESSPFEKCNVQKYLKPKGSAFFDGELLKFRIPRKGIEIVEKIVLTDSK